METLASSKKDVLIVGAGPVGLAMALELTRYGLSVRIVDRAVSRTDKSKALVVWSRTLELIARMGIADRFLEVGRKVRGARICTGSDEIGEFDFSHAATPYPFGLMIPQSETERLLEEHLAELGVTVDRSTEVIGFGETSALLLLEDGSQQIQESTWLIGCDGAHSTIRHKLGFEFRGDALPSDWVLADVHLSGVTSSDLVELYWHADGILGLFPMSETRFRMIADLGPPPDPSVSRPTPALEDVQGLLDARGPGGITASDPVWISMFRINERIVDDYRSAQVFLAGDAAHVHSPAGGQGMNTGIQDACNLAWKLALAKEMSASGDWLLDTYNHERHGIGKLVVQITGQTTKMVLMKGTAQFLRNHLAPLVFGFGPLKELAANAASELLVSYHDSPLSVSRFTRHGTPKAGDRAPVDLEALVGTSLRFALFATHGVEANQLVARFPQLLEPEPRTPFDEKGLWIVRPDGYVGLATHHDDWASAAQYLERLS